MRWSRDFSRFHPESIIHCRRPAESGPVRRGAVVWPFHTYACTPPPNPENKWCIPLKSFAEVTRRWLPAHLFPQLCSGTGPLTLLPPMGMRWANSVAHPSAHCPLHIPPSPCSTPRLTTSVQPLGATLIPPFKSVSGGTWWGRGSRTNWSQEQVFSQPGEHSRWKPHSRHGGFMKNLPLLKVHFHPQSLQFINWWRPLKQVWHLLTTHTW